MDDLEGKISQILNDPAEMSRILALAKSLGLAPPAGDPPESSGAPQPAAQAQEQEQTVPPAPDIPADASPFQGLPNGMMEIIQEFGKVDNKQTALFNALKPFLRPNRREMIDKAMRIAKLSHVAGFAIKNMEHKK